MNRIDPDRLIQLRAARGLSRQRLAKSSHVSARQIARLEVAEEPVDVRATTMSRLAATLDVEPAVLAGEPPVPTDLGVVDVQPVNVLPDVLVELRKRKGWSRRQLAEAARVSPQMIERTERAARAGQRACADFGAARSFHPGFRRADAQGTDSVPCRIRARSQERMHGPGAGIAGDGLVPSRPKGVHDCDTGDAGLLPWPKGHRLHRLCAHRIAQTRPARCGHRTARPVTAREPARKVEGASQRAMEHPHQRPVADLLRVAGWEPRPHRRSNHRLPLKEGEVS